MAKLNVTKTWNIRHLDYYLSLLINSDDLSSGEKASKSKNLKEIRDHAKAILNHEHPFNAEIRIDDQFDDTENKIIQELIRELSIAEIGQAEELTVLKERLRSFFLPEIQKIVFHDKTTESASTNNPKKSNSGAGEVKPEKTPNTSKQPSSEQLPLVQEAAYQSYCTAEQTLGKCTDQKAYGWLKDNGPDDYDMPAYDTWAKYVRAGRKHYGTNKNTPKNGRNVRAVDANDDPGILSQISNQHTKPD